MMTREYTKEELDKIHSLGEKTLGEFIRICEKYHLSYFAISGTAIGAVRHGGFIPWDDDVDVFMPRPDFNKLIELWEQGLTTEGYVFEFVSGDASYPALVKFGNSKIFVKEHYAAKVNNLWVDVIPVDGMPAKDEEAAVLIGRATKLRRLFLMSRADMKEGTTPLKRAVKRIAIPLMSLFDAQRLLGRSLDRLGQKIQFGSTGYAGCVTWGLYGAGERYKDDAFDQLTTVEFEGHQFPAICYWDEYLTGIYGDYMQLPPEDKRKTHNITAWRESTVAESADNKEEDE